MSNQAEPSKINNAFWLYVHPQRQIGSRPNCKNGPKSYGLPIHNTLCILKLTMIALVLSLFFSTANADCNPSQYASVWQQSARSGDGAALTLLPQDKGNESPAALGFTPKEKRIFICFI